MYHRKASTNGMSEIPPVAGSTVPLSLDPDYIDRPELRNEIFAKMSARGARAALVGLGGTGYVSGTAD